MGSWNSEIEGSRERRRVVVATDGRFVMSDAARGKQVLRGLSDLHGITVAAGAQPSIAKKTVTPHVLRHTCAMHTLQASGDVRKVSLWLGHASIQSTEIYLRADPTEKLEALAKMAPPTLQPGRFKAPDKLLAMLQDASHRKNYVE